MKPFRKGLRATFALISIALMTACSTLGEYDITVNDVTVYEPASPLRVDGIEDTALQNCLQQTADDIEATEPRDVMSLNCSDAGITSLAGLSQFDQIRLLKLDDNAIRNLLELGRLEALEQLWLNDNDIIDAIPVLHRMGAEDGIDLYKIMHVAEDLVVPMMDQPIRVDRDSLTLGYAGVYSSFLLFAKRAGEKYGVPARDLLVELGRRGTVGGQEDMIEDLALTMSSQKS